MKYAIDNSSPFKYRLFKIHLKFRFIVSIILSEAKLIDIVLQIVKRHMVIYSIDFPLYQSQGRLTIVSMDKSVCKHLFIFNNEV